MNADRFASLTRALAAARSRRRTLAALAGALGLVGLAYPEDAAAAKSGRCKPKCGECERCKRGDCDKKDGKRRCQKGKCKPKADTTGCSVGTCQAGTCVSPPPPSDPNACSNPATTCDPNCGPAGTTCMCMPRVGSPGAVCVNTSVVAGPCVSETTGGCSIPGQVCVELAGCGGGNRCLPPCV